MGGGDGGLKRVVHKRVHLERHQPSTRKRLGYLEKHKDYVKRAKDWHRKEDHIKHLHEKAYFKNPDEYSMDMLLHKQTGGVTLKKKTHLGNDEIKLANSQDAKYVAMREQIDRLAVEKRKASLQFLDAERPNKHTIFVDDDDEDAPSRGQSRAPVKKRKLEDFDVAAHLDTHPSLLGRKANRLRSSQLQKKSLTDEHDLSEETRKAYRELVHRQSRAKNLRKVREELEMRNHLRSKGRRLKVADATDDKPAQYKWFYERKK